MLAKSRAEKRQAKEAKVTEGVEAFMPDDKSVADSISTWGVVNVDSTESGDPTEELRVPSSKLPWAICKSENFRNIWFTKTQFYSFRERWAND